MSPLHFHFGPRFPEAALSCVSVVSCACPIRVHFSEPWDTQIAYTLPIARFHALGWKVTILQVTHLCLFLPQVHRLAISEDSLLPCLAEALLQGCLAQISYLESPQADQHAVQIQVYGRNIWVGDLPGSLFFGRVLEMWQCARQRLGCSPSARICSGPRLVEPSLTLAEARQPASKAWVKRKGRVLVSIHPECRGGGAKDAKYVAAQTSLAKPC